MLSLSTKVTGITPFFKCPNTFFFSWCGWKHPLLLNELSANYSSFFSGRLFFFSPLTSKFNAIFGGCSAYALNDLLLLITHAKFPNPRSKLVFATISIDAFKPSIDINSLVFFLSVSLTSHIALSVLLKIFFYHLAALFYFYIARLIASALINFSLQP